MVVTPSEAYYLPISHTTIASNGCSMNTTMIALCVTIEQIKHCIVDYPQSPEQVEESTGMTALHLMAIVVPSLKQIWRLTG